MQYTISGFLSREAQLKLVNLENPNSGENRKIKHNISMQTVQKNTINHIIQKLTAGTFCSRTASIQPEYLEWSVLGP